jgi:hypothetical protein
MLSKLTPDSYVSPDIIGQNMIMNQYQIRLNQTIEELKVSFQI